MSKKLPILLDGGRVSIYLSGHRTFVDTDFGVNVGYDGATWVSISVPSNYRYVSCISLLLITGLVLHM